VPPEFLPAVRLPHATVHGVQCRVVYRCKMPSGDETPTLKFNETVRLKILLLCVDVAESNRLTTILRRPKLGLS